MYRWCAPNATRVLYSLKAFLFASHATLSCDVNLDSCTRGKSVLSKISSVFAALLAPLLRAAADLILVLVFSVGFRGFLLLFALMLGRAELQFNDCVQQQQK